MTELDILDEEYFNNEEEENHCKNKMYANQQLQINECENKTREQEAHWIDEFACEHFNNADDENDEVEKTGVTIMVQPTIMDTATIYQLYKQPSKQQRPYDYYWIDTTHDIIMPELFDNTCTATRWLISTCIENDISYTVIDIHD